MKAKFKIRDDVRDTLVILVAQAFAVAKSNAGLFDIEDHRLIATEASRELRDLQELREDIANCEVFSDPKVHANMKAQGYHEIKPAEIDELSQRDPRLHPTRFVRRSECVD